MSEQRTTLRQIVEAFRGEISWMRVFPGGQRMKYENFMDEAAIRRAVEQYGGRRVWRVQPGFRFIMIYTD